MESYPPIAPKLIEEFTPDAYHAYVSGMYFLKGKSTSPALGISVTRSKKTGKLSVKLTEKRAFAYVLHSEVEAFAKKLETTQTEVWNAFKEREFILAKTRMEAETQYSAMKAQP